MGENKVDPASAAAAPSLQKSNLLRDNEGIVLE